VVPTRLDVAENRGYLLPLKRMGGSHKCHRRRDNLTLETDSPRSYLERDRTIAHGDTMANTDQLCDALLELLDHWTTIGQYSAIEDVLQPFKETLFIADIRCSDVKRLQESGFSAKDRQLIQSFSVQSSLPCYHAIHLRLSKINAHYRYDIISMSYKLSMTTPTIFWRIRLSLGRRL
jgi:hypothetical protein